MLHRRHNQYIIIRIKQALSSLKLFLISSMKLGFSKHLKAGKSDCFGISRGGLIMPKTGSGTFFCQKSMILQFLWDHIMPKMPKIFIFELLSAYVHQTFGHLCQQKCLMNLAMFFYPFVFPFATKVSELAHYFFLIFSMKLDSHRLRKVMKPYF